MGMAIFVADVTGSGAFRCVVASRLTTGAEVFAAIGGVLIDALGTTSTWLGRARCGENVVAAGCDVAGEVCIASVRLALSSETEGVVIALRRTNGRSSGAVADAAISDGSCAPSDLAEIEFAEAAVSTVSESNGARWIIAGDSTSGPVTGALVGDEDASSITR